MRKGFLLGVERADLTDVDAVAEQGPVIHSTRLALVDGAQQIRGYYDSEDPAARARLIEDIKRLLAGLPV